MGWNIVSGPEVGHWTAEKLKAGYFAERSNAIGFVRDGKLVAGVIYENWNGKSLINHIVIEGRVNRTFLRSICDYAFNVCKVNKSIAPVSSDNEKSIKFVEKMGYKKEATIKDAHPKGDILIYSLVREDCRFLEV